MKKLILNPNSETQKKIQMLDFDTVLADLVAKVLGTKDPGFVPFIFDERHARRFIANVEPRITSVTPFVGKPINSFLDGVSYLNEIAPKIYKNLTTGETYDWKIKALKSFIAASKGNAFGLNVPSEEAINKIKSEFNDAMIIAVEVQNVPNPITAKNMKTKQPTKKTNEREGQ